MAVAEDPPVRRYIDHPDVHAFIDARVAEGFDKNYLVALFAQAEYKQSIVDAISRPAEFTHTWKTYQDIFLTESRIRQGQQFMLENARALKLAEAKFGVPVEIITAIIGVETMYGRIRGSYRVIDSLSTLAFDYPPRSAFFRSELKHFLHLVKEENQDARLPKGSYAGAMGYGQFIPSSYRHYAIDFDGDGQRDIWNNKTDAIGSVANYLALHGWQDGELITVKATLVEDSMQAGPASENFNKSLKPTASIASMEKLGLHWQQKLKSEPLISPMLLHGKQGIEYWLGLKNFYVITRYNHSKLYAMAVFQLSQRLRDF
ncbi:MAG: lytic murein transglycosylase B [Pseudomonadales bacterium]|nr:lytic murein transglycosylase B [Pseudomonadales bacterium]